MVMNALFAFIVCAAPNLLENASFDTGLEAWQTNSATARCVAESREGRSLAGILVAPTSEAGFPYFFQEFPISGGDIATAEADALGHEAKGGYGPYIALEFYDAEGKRITHSQSNQFHEQDVWNRVDVTAVAPEGAVKMRYCLILNGQGEAWFDNALLRAMPFQKPMPLDGPVTLRDSGETVCAHFNGFGAEDDGWFYGPDNQDKGVTEEDCQLREGRIEWMDPDWVRMFFWHKDWCPSGDWQTFTFDSPNMQSHFRTLDLYQRIGARVCMTGVEWGMPDSYKKPAEFAHALGELLEHLIRVKKYTCIQDWTLTNEPNGAFCMMGYTHAQFVEIHRLVREEFKRRGLALRIIGSDDAQDLGWFRACANNEEYYGLVDLFSSHRYFPYPDRAIAGQFVDARLAEIAEKPARKDFIVAEFGFHDSRASALKNPIMRSYPYAVWTTEFVVDGLNRGVAGFSIWCVQESYYPGNGLMEYGLWNFKEDGWKPRPVYHAWANFSRLTEAGDQVHRIDSTHPSHIKASRIGNALFWVNISDESAAVHLEGMNGSKARIHTEKNLNGDRETGEEAAISGGQFMAPPQSFGYVILEK